MRTGRQMKILEIIEAEPITTQEELQGRLQNYGFEVTQATISRDIKALRLVKTLDKNGIYRYTVLKPEEKSNTKERYLSILRDTVIQVDAAENMVAIKCHVGMANAACAALDSMGFPQIVGTLSGDDTIFILLRSALDASRFSDIVREYLANP